MVIPRRDWLTAPEVAAQFNVTVQSVRLWILTGQLEGEQAMNRTWLIHESAVEQFKARRAVSSTDTRHNCDTPTAAKGGGPRNRPSVRSTQVLRVDPNKRYRIKSTGEVISGAELLNRRKNPQ